MEEALKLLLDENDIKRLVTLLSYAIDERDVEKCRRVFADEVFCDFDRLGGARLCSTISADTLATQMIARIGHFRMTQHVNTMHHVTVIGDDAKLTAYVIGIHYLDPDPNSAAIHGQDPWNTIGARYEMTARRFPEGWLFTNWIWRLMWSRDNHDVWNDIGRRMKA